MKKLLLLILIGIFLTGCVTYKFAKYVQLPSVTDFRPFTESGFFISPGMEGVSYKPIGLIRYTFSPGIINNNSSKKKQYASYHEDVYDMYGRRVTENNKTIEEEEDNFFQPDEAYMIERVVEYAKMMGATGLLNYRISYSDLMPSLNSRIATECDELTILKPHPKQVYGEATITAFAIEVIK